MTAPSAATQFAARRILDARPRNRAEAFEVARRYWPRADASALHEIVALAMQWMKPQAPTPEPVVIVTPIGAGRVRPDSNIRETA